MRSFLQALGFALLFIVVQIVGGVLIAVLGLPSPTLDDLDVAGAFVLCLLELFVLVAALLIVQQRGGWRALGVDMRGAVQARGWMQLAPVGLLVILPSLLVAATGDGDVISDALTVPVAAGLILFAVLVGLAEELWFRGIVMSALGGSARPWFAVLGSALLFGAPHALASSDGITAATVLNASAVTLAIAVPFACVRIRSRAFVPLVGWHAAIDIWAFLHTASITAKGDPSVTEMLAGLVLPSLIAIGYLAWMRLGIERDALTQTEARPPTTMES